MEEKANLGNVPQEIKIYRRPTLSEIAIAVIMLLVTIVVVGKTLGWF